MEEYDFSNLPEGVIQLKNHHDILYYFMEPDIEEVIKHDSKNKDRIKDLLDVLLEIIEHRDKGTDAFFALVELMDKIDTKDADNYLKLYEDFFKRRNETGSDDQKSNQ
jgi:hypothetical protein